MNLEQRSRIYRLINLMMGLLDYAVRIGDRTEEERLRGELQALLEQAE